MPDFQGRQTIKLQPNTANMPISMTFSVCSSATANDGAIPYGDTIESAEVLAYAPDGTDETDDMVTTEATVDGEVVSFAISYYTTLTGAVPAVGRHKLTAILTMASGYVDEFDLKRVIVTDT